jgi:hypothetical protein
MNVLKLIRYKNPAYMPGITYVFSYRAERFREHEFKLKHLLDCSEFIEGLLSQVVSLAKAHGWRVEIRDAKKND